MWGEVIILAAVQALTEFLPVSSSGHLVLVPALAGWTDPFLTGLTLSVALHVGTGLALVIALWSDWVWLARGVVGKGPSVQLARRLLAALVGSTLLIGLIALPLRGWLTTLRDPTLAAMLLIVFGLGLAAADRFGANRRDLASTPFAFWVAIGTVAIRGAGSRGFAGGYHDDGGAGSGRGSSGRGQVFRCFCWRRRLLARAWFSSWTWRSAASRLATSRC